MDLARLAKLAAPGSILDKYSAASLPEGGAKVGEGLENIVIGKDFIESNSQHPTNPGFHFGVRGSELRQGPHLDIEGDYKKVFFKGGDQQLNPLGNIKASSTTDPLPTVVPSLRSELTLLLSPDLQKVLELLKSLPI